MHKLFPIVRDFTLARPTQVAQNGSTSHVKSACCLEPAWSRPGPWHWLSRFPLRGKLSLRFRGAWPHERELSKI